jgi:hypothetical protein
MYELFVILVVIYSAYTLSIIMFMMTKYLCYVYEHIKKSGEWIPDFF